MAIRPIYMPTYEERRRHFAQEAREALRSTRSQTEISRMICHDAMIELAFQARAISDEAADQLRMDAREYHNPSRFAPTNGNSYVVTSQYMWRDVPEGYVVVFLGRNLGGGARRVLSHSMVCIGQNSQGRNRAAGTNNLRIGGPPDYAAVDLENLLAWDANGTAAPRNGSVNNRDTFRVVAVNMIANAQSARCNIM